MQISWAFGMLAHEPQVHVASSLSVDLTWWPRRTTPTAPDFLPRYQSEASQSTTEMTKHSAATAGQLPLGTGGEFLVDQRRIFGTSNRENFTDMFFHSVAFNRKFPPTPILRGTPSQYKRRNSGSTSVLSKYASGRTTSSSKHSRRFPGHRRSLHRFPFIGFVETPVLLSSCAHDATCAMTGADGPNSA